ncbi:hypothetical protein D3C72_1894140 [compost metagenome]
MGVHGQGSGRAVVRANQRVRMGAGIDHHLQAELMGQVHRMRALEKNRVDVTAQQTDQLIVALADAGDFQADFRTIDMLLLIVAVGPAIGVVHQFDVGHCQAFELKGVFQAAQGLGTGEVNLHVGPFRQAETTVFQVANALDSAFLGGQDQLHLVTPGQPQ